MVTTGLSAAYVVGFDGTKHVLWRNGQVVFKGDTIVYVGRDYQGQVDHWHHYGQALIGPGFIDLDALGDLDSTILTYDGSEGWKMGRQWSEDYLAAGPQESHTPEQERFKYRYAFTQLIRNGVTTAMPITSMYYRQWAESYDEFCGVAEEAATLGIRAYLGPCYMSGMTYFTRQGERRAHWDEQKGLAGLAMAERFFHDYHNSSNGLIQGALLPDRIETCTPALLSRTAALSKELDAPVRLHCCQSVTEFETVLSLRGHTPLGWLESLSLLSPRAILPHGIYISGHPMVSVNNQDDIARLRDYQSTVVHCPIVFARDGEALNSFGRYLKQGVNLAMGTDTFPADPIDNLRQGYNIARLQEFPEHHTQVLDLYNAATLGGAKALGREDLGRLSPGAKADITVFDLAGFHIGPLFDPIKNLILSASGRDCKASFINGRCVMNDFVVQGVNETELQNQASKQYQVLMQSHSRRAFDNPPWRSLITPTLPYADEQGAQMPLFD